MPGHLETVGGYSQGRDLQDLIVQQGGRKVRENEGHGTGADCRSCGRAEGLAGRQPMKVVAELCPNVFLRSQERGRWEC